jgi:hypothetical protein
MERGQLVRNKRAARRYLFASQTLRAGCPRSIEKKALAECLAKAFYFLHSYPLAKASGNL